MTIRAETRPTRENHNLKNKLKGIGAVGTSMLVMGTMAATANANSSPKAPSQSVPQEIAKLKTKLSVEHDHIISDKKQISRLTVLLSRLAGSGKINKTDILGSNLKRLRDLPAFGEKISQSRQEQLTKSTVHIIYRAKGSEEDWIDNCTATKISDRGRDYIRSAKHCFTSAKNNGDITTSQAQTAHNYIEVSDYEYAVSYGKDIHTPVAYVSGMSLSEIDDSALLKVESSQKGGSGSVQEAWNKIPALKYDSMTPQPVPGEQVAISGYAWINGFRLSTGTGTYLGSIKSLTDSPDGLPPVVTESYYVGINPYGFTSDRCNYGDSGGAFSTQSGFFSGGLEWRNNIGYSNGLPNPNGTTTVERPDIAQRMKYEKELGVDTSGFATVCKFSGQIMDTGHPKMDTIANLVQGFNYPVSRFEGDFGNQK